MALQLNLEGGRYSGPRRFVNKDKNFPDLTDTTPTLIIPIDHLPRSFALDNYKVERIACPTNPDIEVKSLYTPPGSKLPFGIAGKITVGSFGFTLVGTTDIKPTKFFELGALGTLDKDLKWELPAYIEEEGAEARRIRCRVIMSEIVNKATGPSSAVEFTKRYYSYNLDPKPLIRP